MPSPKSAPSRVSLEQIQRLREAARDSLKVSGPTHNFYRYPARFSPQFAAAAIELFSKPGALVLDPFMGSATTVVESHLRGRRALGADVNSLSVFIARSKMTRLSRVQMRLVHDWATKGVPNLRAQIDNSRGALPQHDSRTHNLDQLQSSALRKQVELAVASLQQLTDSRARQFARAVLLSASQWAIDGRQHRVSCAAFRERIADCAERMLLELCDLAQEANTRSTTGPYLLQSSAADLPANWPAGLEKADLVVTSPPYPGIHILYHRWQVHGRRETPAPYWITDTQDGRGNAFYNLGNRFNKSGDDYFDNLAASFRALRTVVKDRALVVQLVSFASPKTHLPRYLATLADSGFTEVNVGSAALRQERIWRSVPNRAWHATAMGKTPASREVVLLHVAR